MLTVNNKQYRNLEEQVQKNKEDIARHYEIDRVLSDWGIKVLGVVNSVENIPQGDYEYGDAYGVRSEDEIIYYVWTRANLNIGQSTDYWLNIGGLSIVGPQGPRGNVGPIGPQGRKGSQWYSGLTAPSPNTSYYANDHYLNTTTGDVYRYYGRNDDPNLVGHWSLVGSIKGPQGSPGTAGPQGLQGPAGPAGPQGAKGDAGQSFQIAGFLASTDLLPTPSAAIASKAYAVGSVGSYNLYVAAPDENNTYVWVNMGPVAGVEGPQGPAGPQGEPGLGATTVAHNSDNPLGGTITPESLTLINTDPNNIVLLVNNEMYYPADFIPDASDYIYSHLGYNSGKIYTKTLNLNKATGSYTIIVSEVGAGGTTVHFLDTLPEAGEVGTLYVVNNKFYQWAQDPNYSVGYGSIADLQNWALNRLVQYKFTPPTSGAQELYNAFSALGLGEGEVRALASGNKVEFENETWANPSINTILYLSYHPESWYGDGITRYVLAIQNISPGAFTGSALCEIQYNANTNSYNIERAWSELYEPKMVITEFTNDSTLLPFLNNYWTIYNGTWEEVSPTETPTSLEFLTKLSMIDDVNSYATIFRNNTEPISYNHFFRFGSSGNDAIWANEYGGKFILFGPNASNEHIYLINDQEISNSITFGIDYNSVVNDSSKEQYIIFAAAPWGLQHRNLLYKYPTQSGTLMVKEDIQVVVNDDNTIDLIIN